MPELHIILGVFGIPGAEAFAILCIPLSGVLRAEDLAKGTGNGGALESNLAVVHAIDVTDQHVHAAVVSAIRHCQHVIEGPGASQQGQDAPECTTTQVCSTHTLEFFRAGHLDHGYTGSNVNQKVGVYVRSGLGKFHRFGIGIAVGEDFVRYLGDEEIEAYSENCKRHVQPDIAIARSVPVIKHCISSSRLTFTFKASFSLS